MSSSSWPPPHACTLYLLHDREACMQAAESRILRWKELIEMHVNVCFRMVLAEVAVVTGASRGIGRAIALALGAEGAKVGVSHAFGLHRSDFAVQSYTHRTQRSCQ